MALPPEAALPPVGHRDHPDTPKPFKYLGRCPSCGRWFSYGSTRNHGSFPLGRDTEWTPSDDRTCRGGLHIEKLEKQQHEELILRTDWLAVVEELYEHRMEMLECDRRFIEGCAYWMAGLGKKLTWAQAGWLEGYRWKREQRA